MLLGLFCALPFAGIFGPGVGARVSAASCPDVKLIFARGSGEAQNLGKNFLALNAALGAKMQKTDLSYQSEDLVYPATAVGFRNFDSVLVSLGALISGGEAYEFGRSVKVGVEQLVSEVNSPQCPNTKYVLAGYSQGAMLLDKALRQIDPGRVLYAATFGDPKLYLPEGWGVFPDACEGRNLSDYRAYVPECHAYQGILGGYNPYRAETYIGKIGTWCNAHDVMCTSYLNFENHRSYTSAGLYEDASRVMFNKIANHFALASKVSSPHDTVILIDSTGSMRGKIAEYKKEAIRLAQETLDSGGRVALFDYRDLNDPYQPVQHCGFENCDIATFTRALDSIRVGGGGDDNESLLSAALSAMHSLKWQYGATKSLIVLTDAGFHLPDRDGATLDQVVAVSKSIDPVNFYIITDEKIAPLYQELAERTDGKVITNLGEAQLLTDYIMERYDSLPPVEESSEPLNLPTLSIEAVEPLGAHSARVKYLTDASMAMVFLNDAYLGITNQIELTISDLDPEFDNVLILVPLSDELRGSPVAVSLSQKDNPDTPEINAQAQAQSGSSSPSSPQPSWSGPTSTSSNLPKAPDTGRPN